VISPHQIGFKNYLEVDYESQRERPIGLVPPYPRPPQHFNMLKQGQKEKNQKRDKHNVDMNEQIGEDGSDSDDENKVVGPAAGIPMKRKRSDDRKEKKSNEILKVKSKIVQDNEILSVLKALLNQVQGEQHQNSRSGLVSSDESEEETDGKDEMEQTKRLRHKQKDISSDPECNVRKERKYTEEEKETRLVLTEHFGDLTKLDPLTYELKKETKDEITREAVMPDPFYPKIGPVERPMKLPKPFDKEKEKIMPKQMTDVRLMYDLQMATLHHIINGRQDEACDSCLRQIDITLDRASNCNLERYSLRASPQVVESIRHAGEEPVVRDSYRKVTEALAKEDNDLRVITQRKFFPQRTTRLRGWKTRRPGWSSDRGPMRSAGRRNSSQSKFYSAGDTSRFQTRHSSAGRSFREREPEDHKKDRQTPQRSYSPGSKKG
jgi:hypothetical protein